jgi:hypothetical protein
MPLNGFNGLFAINTLLLKIGLASFGLMNVRWSVELVSVENGRLLGQKTSQNLDKFKAFHNGENKLSRCFGLLSRALPVELV